MSSLLCKRCNFGCQILVHPCLTVQFLRTSGHSAKQGRSNDTKIVLIRGLVEEEFFTEEIDEIETLPWFRVEGETCRKPKAAACVAWGTSGQRVSRGIALWQQERGQIDCGSLHHQPAAQSFSSGSVFGL